MLKKSLRISYLLQRFKLDYFIFFALGPVVVFSSSVMFGLNEVTYFLIFFGLAAGLVLPFNRVLHQNLINLKTITNIDPLATLTFKLKKQSTKVAILNLVTQKMIFLNILVAFLLQNWFFFLNLQFETKVLFKLIRRQIAKAFIKFNLKKKFKKQKKNNVRLSFRTV